MLRSILERSRGATREAGPRKFWTAQSRVGRRISGLSDSTATRSRPDRSRCIPIELLFTRLRGNYLGESPYSQVVHTLQCICGKAWTTAIVLFFGCFEHMGSQPNHLCESAC